MDSNVNLLGFCNKGVSKMFPASKTTWATISGVILMACIIIYVYCSPNISFNKFTATRVQVNNISAEACLSVLRTENYRCTADVTSDELPMAPKPLPDTAEKEEPETLLLIWMWPFGVSFGLGPCSTAFNIHGCRLTDDRGLFNQAHGVMFHHRDISGDISNMPQQPRPAFQKWIWWNMESPSNSYPIGPLNGLFNLTSNYRRDSDVPVPYGWLTEATEEQKKYTIPKKDKLVCWIVSNYRPSYRRSQYYTELAEHIHVSAYGRHFNNPVSDADYSNVVSSCKFYLSFENSVHRDYMTEKLFNALALGAVPVVLGPSRDNYEQFIPSNAFIHVDDFPSAKEMADHLKHLDQNEELYMQYFTWREHFVSTRLPFGLAHACHICDHIRRHKEYKAVKDLNGWYWG
ncbi:4-galactosyl-N-acetylglucosaminide 3-alpha-L-fucosyltransferase 9-like [Labeo rohita]|uniref:4-galactosyl-N-acetylglucosaminide 3-alpha-L-fucosyltransferase 9-like n=1 Tax=Labeo rohita TaxID=84645 RepID=UPI0021E1CB71|nr:4-galactosyl-N-acetylglucosaminide 3-alpha-L-fucosyltransferase 9-like [Labeo rohita]